jgi:hypothetical protein
LTIVVAAIGIGGADATAEPAPLGTGRPCVSSMTATAAPDSATMTVSFTITRC